MDKLILARTQVLHSPNLSRIGTKKKNTGMIFHERNTSLNLLATGNNNTNWRKMLQKIGALTLN